MKRTRLLIAALFVGTGLFLTSSSAEARPFHRVYRAPVILPPVVAPACIPNRVYRPVYHYRAPIHGRRWHR